MSWVRSGASVTSACSPGIRRTGDQSQLHIGFYVEQDQIVAHDAVRYSSSGRAAGGEVSVNIIGTNSTGCPNMRLTFNLKKGGPREGP
jgi:hypothetical protein